MAHLAAVERRHRNVFDERADLAQTDQHRALEEKPRWEGRDLEGLERRAMDGGVPVGRIENIPLAGRRLDEKRETRVAHAPAERHAPERGGVVKAVALGVVGPPGDERLDPMRSEE